MKTNLSLTVGAGALLLAATGANAQSSRTDDLARQWRESRLADLQKQRAAIDAQIAALPSALPDAADTVPPPVPAPAAPVPAAPAPAAQAVAAAPATTAPAAKTNDPPLTDAGQPANGRQTFGGLDLGVGLSFTLDIGKLDRISRASVINGVVRSDDQDNGRARIMLESHYFFTPCTWNFLGLKNPCTSDPAKGNYLFADPKEARWGLGPFIAIQPGSDNIIDAIGMGIMVGARREQSGQSFNLGVGVVFDPNTRVLGDGIVENQPLPVGETEVRYRETLQTGILVLTSFSF